VRLNDPKASIDDEIVELRNMLVEKIEQNSEVRNIAVEIFIKVVNDVVEKLEEEKMTTVIKNTVIDTQALRDAVLSMADEWTLFTLFKAL
jgi:hypothetical protein